MCSLNYRGRCLYTGMLESAVLVHACNWGLSVHVLQIKVNLSVAPLEMVLNYLVCYNKMR